MFTIIYTRVIRKTCIAGDCQSDVFRLGKPFQFGKIIKFHRESPQATLAVHPPLPRGVPQPPTSFSLGKSKSSSVNLSRASSLQMARIVRHIQQYDSGPKSVSDSWRQNASRQGTSSYTEQIDEAGRRSNMVMARAVRQQFNSPTAHDYTGMYMGIDNSKGPGLGVLQYANARSLSSIAVFEPPIWLDIARDRGGGNAACRNGLQTGSASSYIAGGGHVCKQCGVLTSDGGRTGIGTTHHLVTPKSKRDGVRERGGATDATMETCSCCSTVCALQNKNHTKKCVETQFAGSLNTIDICSCYSTVCALQDKSHTKKCAETQCAGSLNTIQTCSCCSTVCALYDKSHTKSVLKRSVLDFCIR